MSGRRAGAILATVVLMTVTWTHAVAGAASRQGPAQLSTGRVDEAQVTLGWSGDADVTRPAGGAFSAAVDLSATGRNAAAAQVTIDDSGGAVAIGQRQGSGSVDVQVVRRQIGGRFSVPRDLSAPGVAGAPQVGIDRTGEVVAVWERLVGPELAGVVVETNAGAAAVRRRPRLAAPASARVGQRVAVTARDLAPGRRYVLRLARQGNPRGESTPCTADLSPPRRVGRTTTFHARVPTRLTCRLHGVGPSLGTVPVGPGAGYRFTACAPEGRACRADASFVSRAVRITP